jgi:phosphorylcholine metabolism protein LicD
MGVMVEFATLARAAKVLDKAKIEWWLIDGTCLSMVRSETMEDWQKDIDVGVWEIAPARAALLKAGWKDFGSWPYQFKSDGKLDMLAHRRDGDRVLVDYVEDVTYGFSGHLFDKFDSVTVHGHTFKIPSPVDQYLSEHYGDWRTPITRGWIWQEAPCVTNRK